MNSYIVITGGAGFIGSNLIEFFLREEKYKILSIDNYSSGSFKNHIKNKRVKYIKGDINNIEKHLFKYKNNINCIFHFGEYSRIHQSFKDYKKCFKSNISGTSKVFSFCLENNIKIVYSATSASLGNKGNDENLSPYAFSKSKNLQLLIHLRKWFGLSFEALYFFNVYGPRQISEGSMATVIGIFEEQFTNKKFITVVKPGNQSRKFTHVKDTVKGCYLAWKKNLNKHYALSNTKSYSIIQVAKLFSKKIRLIKRRLGERNKSAAVNKIGSIKIIKIKCSIDLKNYINNFKKNN
jgi:UDP-glucose 4-epimerase